MTNEAKFTLDLSLRDGNAVEAIQRNFIAFNLSLREFCVAKFVAIYEYKI
ncbi:hypothetical protein OFO10_06570 [Campylobacter sp. VBCF_06 NA8]|nr:hypothetical protein [Campylobacter sp. VBCF_06 NA8]MDA3046817.1 hypothetical protein [Campylobacter sp. VBCF_06 NA8]